MGTNPRYQITRVITPADSLALITLDQAKAALGIDPADTSQDAKLQQQIDAVSAAIDNWCDRIFVRQTYRDQFRYAFNWLNPGEPLQTRQYPIPLDTGGVPVLVIAENGSTLDAAVWEIEIESGSLYRLNNSAAVSAWTGTSIVVDYDAGYDTIPADVQGTALEWLTARWGAIGRDPALRSETIPDLITQVYSTDTTMPSMPSGVRECLSGYRRWHV
jgi:hypothetical protein